MSRFRMTFLGVGSGVTPEFGNTNVLIEGNTPEAKLMLDCGVTGPLRLLEQGRLAEVGHLVVSHVHTDHAGGLETVATLARYVYHRRPVLYVPTAMWDELWGASMRGGLEKSQDERNAPTIARLDDYFEVRLLADPQPRIDIPGLPTLTMKPTRHVTGKPAYSFFLGDRIYYSADTQELPPTHGPAGTPLEAIFQDCQLFSAPSNVHTPLERLEQEMSPGQKRITHLMHYGKGYERIDAEARGFAGWVRPMDCFEFEG